MKLYPLGKCSFPTKHIPSLLFQSPSAKRRTFGGLLLIFGLYKKKHKHKKEQEKNAFYNIKRAVFTRVSLDRNLIHFRGFFQVDDGVAAHLNFGNFSAESLLPELISFEYMESPRLISGRQLLLVFGQSFHRIICNFAP